MSEWGTYVPGYGPNNAQLAIVGIAPAAEEVIAGRPFVGPSGALLAEDLRDAGYNIKRAYLTNIFKYKLPNNEFAKYKEMGLNLPEALATLEQEIYQIQPNCILGLGDPVLYCLAGKSGKNNGINVWRGSIFESVFTKKAVFTWHPAHELHGSGEGTFKAWQKYIRKFDIKRAVDESVSPELNLPKRIVHIAGSSADLYRFLERNRREQYCALDIESICGIPVCIGLSFQPWEAMVVPLWNEVPIELDSKKHPKKSFRHKLQVSTIPFQDLAYMLKLLAEFLLNKLSFHGERINVKKAGQNFKYDEDKINRLGFYLDYLYWDTSISQHCIASEMLKSLAFQTSIKTREPYYKFEGKEFNYRTDSIENFFYYCGKDCCTTREILDVDMKDLEMIPHGMRHMMFRMQLHKAYLEVERTGFAVDERKRTELIYQYVDRLTTLEKELWELCKQFGVKKPVNVRSHPKVAELLYETLGIPRREGTGEQVLTALMANNIKDVHKYRICELVLEIRRVDKSLGYLQAEPDYDLRMKTSFNICGTENYRTSTSILEPPIRPEKIGWALQTVTKHGDTGQDLRSILIADRGFVIVNIDQSQAEARVCSNLADDKVKLAQYDSMDVHAATAAKFFGGKMEQYSKKVLGYECPQRFIGKTLRHAYHLGIGKREAMINVNTDARKYKIKDPTNDSRNMNISEWFAGKCLLDLEKDTPKIQTVYHATIQQLLMEDRRLFGTFGASRYFYDEDGRDLWKSAYSFIPQQTVSDKTKMVLIKIVNNLRDVKVCVESHDALTMQIREKVLDERIEQIQEWFAEPIDFSICSIPRDPLVIPTEVEIGYDYCDLDRYKPRKK